MADRHNPVDRMIGHNIARAMASAGISPERLAAMLDVRGVIVQEWIAGERRVGAARLFDVCVATRVPVSFMYKPGRKFSVWPVRRAASTEHGS